MIEILILSAASIVLYRTISTIATVNIHTFDGHPIKFIGMAIHWALVASGSVAMAIGLSVGGLMLLVGLAMMCLTDRRKP